MATLAFRVVFLVGLLTSVGCFRISKKEVNAVRTAAVVKYESNDAFANLDAEKINQILTFGVSVITNAIAVFTEDPPDIEYGWGMCRLQLWKMVKMIVPTEQHRSDEMKRAKAAWDAAFEGAAPVTEDIIEFRETGDTKALRRAIRTILTTAAKAAGAGFPDADLYFQSLSDLVDGVMDSWELQAEGKTPEAIQAVWAALKVALHDLAPDEVLSNELFVAVMNGIDWAVADLMQVVFRYKESLASSKVCQKKTVYRRKIRPNQCRDGFEWDQGHLCHPTASTGANCYAPCGREEGMCDSFCGVGKACCRKGDDEVPECRDSTGYVDFDFTSGSPSDYHQCVSPGPALKFVVKGAGDWRINGIYVENGVHSGKPEYHKVGDKTVILHWSESRQAWRFFVDDTWFGFGRKTLYKASSDTASVPISGSWEVEDGDQPAPTLEAYSAPSSFASLQTPYGTHEAECVESSNFHEKSGQWCLEECGAGFTPKSASQCIQDCPADYPAEGWGAPGMCGKDDAEILVAASQIIYLLGREAIKIGELMLDVQQRGLPKDVAIPGIVDSFVEIGKSFNVTTCA